MKKPFLYASGAVLYIAFIVLVMQITSHIVPTGTILVPMTMLSLFVLSAAVMGFLFLSEPLYLLVENKKREAIVYFGKIVCCFACYVIIFGVLSLIGSSYKTSEVTNGKLNINVVCESALAYTTFPNSASSDKFIEECKEGKHPEVVERYKSQMNLGDGKAI